MSRTTYRRDMPSIDPGDWILKQLKILHLLNFLKIKVVFHKSFKLINSKTYIVTMSLMPRRFNELLNLSFLKGSIVSSSDDHSTCSLVIAHSGRL